MKLNEKQSSLTTLLQEKIRQMQQIEQRRQQLANEIISMQGQLKLLDELLVEEKKDEKEN